MPTAYVLVLCNYSYSEYEIMGQLSKLPHVTEVNRVDGPYDIIEVIWRQHKCNWGVYRKTYSHRITR